MANNIQWNLVKFTIGKGLEVSEMSGTAFPHFTKHDPKDSLTKIKSSSQDFVVVADIEVKSLTEYWRVLKNDAYLSIICNEKTLGSVNSLIKQLKRYDIQVNKSIDDMTLIVIKKIDFVVKVHKFERPKLIKTAMVVRFGAFGDLMQTSSVCAGLKQQGYNVALISQAPGNVVVTNDPNVDELIVLERDQVPNAALGQYFEFLETQYDKVVNLCESVEGTFLAMKGRPAFKWTQEARHSVMNKNYVEFMHALAGIPYELQVKFYPTLEEKKWAKSTRAKLGEVVVMWSLAGSSVHKSNAQLDDVIKKLLLTYSNVNVVLVGGPECEMLEVGWENDKRVTCTSGKWSIRQTLSMIEHMDLIIGPETGVLNAACCLKVPKIVFLSHSSVENLTRDWTNTTSLFTETEDLPCSPCHRLHFGWDDCHQDPITGTALCQSMMKIDDTLTEIYKYLDPIAKRKTFSIKEIK